MLGVAGRAREEASKEREGDHGKALEVLTDGRERLRFDGGGSDQDDNFVVAALVVMAARGRTMPGEVTVETWVLVYAEAGAWAEARHGRCARCMGHGAHGAWL